MRGRPVIASAALMAASLAAAGSAPAGICTARSRSTTIPTTGRPHVATFGGNLSGFGESVGGEIYAVDLGGSLWQVIFHQA